MSAPTAPPRRRAGRPARRAAAAGAAGDPLPAALVRRAGRRRTALAASSRRGTAPAPPRARRRLRRPDAGRWRAMPAGRCCATTPDCPCAGADECVFARFVALAAEGAREDAVLMAALMVRADIALGLATLAESIGLAPDARHGAAASSSSRAQGRRRRGRPGRRPPRRSAPPPSRSGSTATAM